MSLYSELVALFTDDGGTWTVLSNWDSAREFVKTVIGRSTMSVDERLRLEEIENEAFTMFYDASNFLFYTDDEIKQDIKSYSDFLYAYVKDNSYPEQVRTVFLSLTESVVTPETELGDTSVIMPKWLKYTGIALVVYLVIRR